MAAIPATLIYRDFVFVYQVGQLPWDASSWKKIWNVALVGRAASFSPGTVFLVREQANAATEHRLFVLLTVIKWSALTCGSTRGGLPCNVYLS